jgi:hypothetical protein
VLKKSASVKGPLFGLFGLSRFWLNEANQMNQINQTNKTNQKPDGPGFSQTCGLGLLGKFRRMKAEAGDELTAGGKARQQSYSVLLEVAAGSHK